MTTIAALHELGQSIWLDYIRRHLVRSGQLAALIGDGLRGLTSNPSIFEKAIVGSTDYGDAIAEMTGCSASYIYEQLAVEDLQEAADLFCPVYDATDGADGFVSIEVSPDVADDTARTIAEARRLWQRVARDNLMVKVPATPAGIPAIRQLISEGININITLLFSRRVYAQVAKAYLDGLEAYRGDVRRIASVASFFVSRIDTAVDRLLEARGGSELVGKVAIANARLAYQDYLARLAEPRWRALASRGARPQRLLWASTSTKDPRLPDVYYVEALIGRDTINTVPPATLDAFVEHGAARATLEADLEQARAVIDALPRHGISLSEITDRLTTEGIDTFRAAFEKLVGAIETKRTAATRSHVGRISRRLPAPMEAAVQATLADWHAQGKVRRVWARDAALWTGHDESHWLGWLTVADRERGDEDQLVAFSREVKRRGFSQIALLGTGGTTLAARVLAHAFGPRPGFPELQILDSTDPDEVRAFEASLDLPRTLFIVSSKSGDTLEPNVLADHFYALLHAWVGDSAGEHFVAITDPDRPHLQHVAAERGYWKTFLGEPSIGGRYSALSHVGLVPAAAMGLDVDTLVNAAAEAAHACVPCVPARDNPGLVLGAVLGTLATGGRDKVTLVASPRLVQLGAWIEQLLAESTGKSGRGLIPVDREPLGVPEVYGSDRLFVHLRFDPEPGDEVAITALEHSGQPVVRVSIASLSELGQTFFHWEMATAVAASILGVNAFDQPDVDASKAEARRLTESYERTGEMAAELPFCSDGPLAMFVEPESLADLVAATDGDRSLRGYLRAHLGQLHPGDYFAALAYLPEDDAHRRVLDAIRRIVRDAKHVATCLGFGPQFLHATGQAYKGGPNSGVFLEITHDAANDLAIEGKPYTFGVLEAAQARADLEILTQRERRALRIHIGGDVDAGLQALAVAVASALG